MPLNLGDGQEDEAIFVFPRHIRPGTDKGQVDETFAQQFVDLAVGLALHQFQGLCPSCARGK